jgi:tetratricopeptide (TPR) repeat protein
MVNDQQIEYGSALYKKGIEQFKSNISELIAEYKKAGVEVIISELVSNVSDQPPFKSINKSAQPADMIYGNAADLEREEKYLQAKEQYYRAKDLDALRFRASEDFNKLINQFSEQFDIQVVAMKNRFEESSPNGLIGNNLMLDHLHPNIDGHFIMAEAFCKSILDNELIMAVPDTAFIRDISDYRKNWGYSVLDSVYANMRIEYLKSSWPFTSQRNRPENQNFIPKNRIEEIAMRIWQDRSYTSEDGHADLAQMFESRNMFENAFHEYNALSCLKPLNITAYLKAADVSIKAGNLQRALPFLKYSLKIEKSAFANKWIGIINLDQGDFANAIKNLEIVYNLDIKDPETIYNLALAYYKVGQPDLINKILLDLKKLEKDDSEVKSMILTLEHLIKQSGVQ